jgi:S1-C subfamily serine protease
VLTEIDGGPATSFSLAWLLATAQVGDDVPVTYLRDQSSRQTAITLAEQP